MGGGFRWLVVVGWLWVDVLWVGGCVGCVVVVLWVVGGSWVVGWWLIRV